MRWILFAVLAVGGCAAQQQQAPCAHQAPTPRVVTMYGADQARPAHEDRASETTTAQLAGPRHGLAGSPDYRCTR